MNFSRTTIIGSGAAIVLIVLIAISAMPGSFTQSFKSLLGTKITYVQDISDEVTDIENELKEADAQLLAGTMTSEQAAVTQKRIAKKLVAIQNAAKSSSGQQLTPENRRTIIDSLNRLAVTLKKYSDSLSQLDALAAKQTGKRKSYRHSGSTNNQSIHELISETLEVVVDYIEEVSGEVFENDIVDEVIEDNNNLQEDIDSDSESADGESVSDETQDDNQDTENTGTDGGELNNEEVINLDEEIESEEIE